MFLTETSVSSKLHIKNKIRIKDSSSKSKHCRPHSTDPGLRSDDLELYGNAFAVFLKIAFIEYHCYKLLILHPDYFCVILLFQFAIHYMIVRVTVLVMFIPFTHMCCTLKIKIHKELVFLICVSK